MKPNGLVAKLCTCYSLIRCVNISSSVRRTQIGYSSVLHYGTFLSHSHENNHLQNFCLLGLFDLNSLINKTFQFSFVAVDLERTLFPSQPALLMLIWASSCMRHLFRNFSLMTNGSLSAMRVFSVI